ncbi:MAG: hypothetical protein RLZZ561_716 [Pseudomonadota bacterium]|jgi:DNA-binding CsgD family transcriptional regulator
MGRPEFNLSSLKPQSSDPDNLRLALSSRQRQIMDLMSDGLSNKDIAHVLGLTEGTIKQHIATIFRKLGVSNRTWAASLWLNHAPDEPAVPLKHGWSTTPDVSAEVIVSAPPRLFAAAGLRLDLDSLRDQPDIVGDIYASFISIANDWGRVFGGQVGHHIGGQLIGSFGYPSAHIDDVERACAFALAVQSDLERRFGICPDSFIAAAVDQLVVKGGSVVDTAALRRVMADLRGDVPPKQPVLPQDVPVYGVRGGVIPTSGSADYARVLDHAVRTVPFSEAVRQSFSQSRANWLAVEAWPPIHGKRFLDRFSEINPVDASCVIQLRLTGEAGEDTHNLAAQIRAQISGLHPVDSEHKPVSWWLEYLGQQGPTILAIYGSKNIDSFRQLLSPELISRLADLPLLFLVGAHPLRGSPRLALRSLGTSGERPMVGRVREIVLPEDEIIDAAGFPDLCALIDQASDLERSILQCLSEHNVATRQFSAKSLGASLLSINRGVDNLEHLGLVTTHGDGLLQLRDAATQKAVHNVCHTTAHRPVNL